MFGISKLLVWHLTYSVQALSAANTLKRLEFLLNIEQVKMEKRGKEIVKPV